MNTTDGKWGIHQAEIRKKVQFRKAALFGSKAKMNIFEKYSNMIDLDE